MVVLGIDVGAVSIKVAAFGDRNDAEAMQRLCDEKPEFFIAENDHLDKVLVLSQYRRLKGEPVQTAYELLTEIYKHIPNPAGVRVTGLGSKLIGQLLGAARENDFRAVAHGVGTLHPDVHTIFEMGGVNSKFININVENGTVGIADYETNGDCAAGTGSFIDQQATRLQYDIEEVGDIVITNS